MQSFNFEGRERIHTKIGAFCSVLLYTLMFFLILDKFIQFWFHIGAHNQIYEKFHRHEIEETAYDVKDFHLGFTVKNYDTSDYKFDPSLVEWVVQINEGIGHQVSQEIGTHKCNEKDW